jgi:hypothetical protein
MREGGVPPALLITSEVIGLALAGYMLWMILPPPVKLEMRATVAGEWAKVQSLRDRRKVRKGLEFETWLALGYLEEYNRTREPLELADHLAA